MNAHPPASERLASFVSGLAFADLPSAAVEQACRMFLDAIGCALAATREDARKASFARALAAEFGARGAASIVGGERTHPALAAFANGVLVNAADNDDTHKRTLIHVGSAVVPPALAVCEDAGRTGRDLVVALIAGYEVAARVGMAVMPTHYRFWHSTATNGTFGAAAASAKAMALPAAQVQAALGFAGTQAAGLNAFFETGDDTKSVHPGKAGMNGVLAARLAALGATSPPDIFGHPKGYLAAYSAEPDPAALTRGLGAVWEVARNGYKPYPSILASHSPIGAALDIVRRHRPDPACIERIAIHTYATVKSHFASKAVTSAMAARLSVPYCVAVACVDGVIGPRQFQPARFEDARVRRVLERTEVVADPELTALYPEKFPARVEVTLDGGTILRAEVMYPLGDPENPLSNEALAEKFLDNARDAIPADVAERFVDGALRLDRVADLPALMRPLRAAE